MGGRAYAVAQTSASGEVAARNRAECMTSFQFAVIRDIPSLHVEVHSRVRGIASEQVDNIDQNVTRDRKSFHTHVTSITIRGKVNALADVCRNNSSVEVEIIMKSIRFSNYNNVLEEKFRKTGKRTTENTVVK